MNILVTGGLGFVGSNLVDKLVKSKENKVFVIDNLSSNSSSVNYKNNLAKYYIDDIRNILSINSIPKINIIYHLAGLARIQPSFSTPLDYIDVNVNGTALICEFAIKNNAKLIYSSSSSINKLKEKYYEHRHSSNPIFTSYSFSGDFFGHAALASEQSDAYRLHSCCSISFICLAITHTKNISSLC